MTDQTEIIAAFADGEDVAADELKAALATDAGREYLIDVLALRRMVSDPSAAGAGRDAIAPHLGRPSRAVAAAAPDHLRQGYGGPPKRSAKAEGAAYTGWLTGLAAALVVASAAGGFLVGRETTPAQESNAAPTVTVQATPPELLIPAPSPSRVIHLQTGKDWTERAGGN